MKSILLIDDDLDIQKLLKAFLKDKYNLFFAKDGLEGLQYLKTNKSPDLILLDLDMPLMNGKLFRQKQLSNPKLKDIPVIYLSANDSYKDEVDLSSDFAFLTKPIHKEDLLSVLDSFFRLQNS
jgi:CheY-like chemotaxis protein